MRKIYRVFLDTSVLLTGFNSPRGSANAVLALCFARKIHPIISPQIIEEADRNITLKFPKLEMAWTNFLLLPPEVTQQPTLAEIRNAYKILPTSDAPILAAAIKVRPDALISWDVKHFLNQAVRKKVDFPLYAPPEFLKIFREQD